MVEICYGRSGCGKTRYLAAKAEKLYAEGKRVCFVVPEQLSMTREARFGGRIYAFSFSRLCDTVFRELGGAAKRRPDGVMTAAAIFRAVDETRAELRYYKRAAQQSGFVLKLAEVFSEFDDCRLTREAVEQVPLNDASKRKFADLFLIYEKYKSLWSDAFRAPGDELEEAAALLDKHVIFSDTVFIFDGFYGYTEQQRLLIRRIVAQAESCYFAFTTDMEDDLFLTVTGEAKKIAKLCRGLGEECELRPVSESEPRQKSETLRLIESRAFDVSPESFTADGSATVFNARDGAAELGYVVCRIKNDLLSGKYRCRDIAVLVPDSDGAAAQAAAVFAKHGVPVFVDSKRSLLSEPFCAAVLSALEAVADGFTCDNVFSYLKTGLAGLAFDEVSELERYVRLWNIVGGAWRGEWTRNPYGLPKYQNGDEQERLARLNSLRERTFGPLFALEKKLRAAENCRDMLRAVWELVTDTDMEALLAKRAERFEAQGLLHESERCGRVPETFASVLDGIDAVCGDTKIGLKRFCELLSACAGSVTLASRPAGADEVLFSGIGRARPEKIKCVYVCRMNDGEIPRPASDSGLITDAERRLLQEYGKTTSMDFTKSAIRERFDLYSALTCGSDELIMSCSVFSDSGEKQEPSPFLKAIVNTADITPLTAADLDPDFYLVSRAGVADLAAAGLYIPETDEPDAPRAQADVLPPDVVDALYGKDLRLSFSGVDSYFSCPFSFFMSRGLRTGEQKPVEMGDDSIGNFIHWGFQRLLSGDYDLQNADREAIDRFTAELAKEYLNGPLKDTKDFSARFDRIFEKSARQFSASAGSVVREVNTSGFKPFGFEINIGDFLPPETLPDGATLTVSGYIDRVDVMEKDGKRYAKIIDYKTGKKQFDLNSIYNGVEMQLPFYGEAIRRKYPDTEIAAMYYLKLTPEKSPLSGVALSDDEYERRMRDAYDRSGIFAANGVTEDELGEGVSTKKNKYMLTPDEMDKLMSFTADKLAAAGAGIRSGNAEVSPLTEDSCKYCDFKTVCGICGHPERIRGTEQRPEDMLK